MKAQGDFQLGSQASRQAGNFLAWRPARISPTCPEPDLGRPKPSQAQPSQAKSDERRQLTVGAIKVKHMHVVHG